MEAADVLEIWRELRAVGVEVWIDGGWCVDALLGRQTREHGDLDIAVGRADVGRLCRVLAALGYATEDGEGSTEWNFVMKRDSGASVDIHVFEFDQDGDHVYGIAYPSDSFTGVGAIEGERVHCMTPERMFQLKTAYPPAAKDLLDVRALSARFGFDPPADYRPSDGEKG
ncbi:nucleotidyltransferase domain-containing protein [Nocardia noduli]|uniref:nucleotidyltransferase domain-containing protein n=1 Tax=Nocardia noduli TaxID=2815722 RepID=UPI001C211BFC|nr:nucleotidyltransferase family protein [Nocardia noduli]